MRKRPIYQFNVDTEVGLDKLPIGAFISVGTSTPKTYVLDNKTGILATTTIAQAVTGLNLREQATSVGGSVASADKLTTARSINGVPFDGTANITLPAGSASLSTITDWPATVTSAEVGYLSSVTSDVQAQLNGKAPTSHTHATANITGLDTALAGKASTAVATTLANGLMSSTDKTKLDGLSGTSTYTLPVASATILGGVKAGTNVSIDANGVISANDTAVAFTEITGKPTTLTGYGITDASLSTHTHPVATTTVAGLLSATDKTKLDGLTGTGTYTLPVATSTILGGVKSGTDVAVDVNGNMTVANDSHTHSTYAPTTHTHTEYSATSHIHTAVTTTVDGFMTATDKTKLDGIAIGATAYTHPVNHPASIITQDLNNRFVTDAEKTSWNAKAPTTAVTTTVNGLMIASDKSKLDGVAAGANVNVSTNLSYITAATTGTVVSSDGTNAVIPAATTALAGLMTSTDKNKLDNTDLSEFVFVELIGAVGVSDYAINLGDSNVMFNTVRNNTITGASIIANGQITLPAGTYDFDGSTNMFSVNGCSLSIRQSTSPYTLLQGLAGYSASTVSAMVRVQGRLTFTTPTPLFMSTYAVATGSLGHGASNGYVSFATLLIKKVK